MLMIVLNVIYVLVAIAMIALILLQRGSGAAAGSGFGAGASGTVFGARGAANFMSKTTKWLGVAFFAISMFMAWYATHGGRVEGSDLGVMSQVPVAEVQPVSAPPAAVPAAPAVVEPAAVPAQAETAVSTEETAEKPAQGN
jgi:preprotein translocase subunit SecG